ncbi:hypothetical protein BRADI_3g13095v3 [Brachypodium distachyon]|uniref:Uncharacterized protein n=1 Tax=Brachypodium distachyon TaxID=15368 RepID=A0A2K2CWU2_BRADI|nr:hypothetical protein BRADI_3g13095v3 [Brachypodium distachyon]
MAAAAAPEREGKKSTSQPASQPCTPSRSPLGGEETLLLPPPLLLLLISSREGSGIRGHGSEMPSPAAAASSIAVGLLPRCDRQTEGGGGGILGMSEYESICSLFSWDTFSSLFIFFLIFLINIVLLFSSHN